MLTVQAPSRWKGACALGSASQRFEYDRPRSKEARETSHSRKAAEVLRCGPEPDPSSVGDGRPAGVAWSTSIGRGVDRRTPAPPGRVEDTERCARSDGIVVSLPEFDDDLGACRHRQTERGGLEPTNANGKSVAGDARLQQIVVDSVQGTHANLSQARLYLHRFSGKSRAVVVAEEHARILQAFEDRDAFRPRRRPETTSQMANVACSRPTRSPHGHILDRL